MSSPYKHGRNRNYLRNAPMKSVFSAIVNNKPLNNQEPSLQANVSADIRQSTFSGRRGVNKYMVRTDFRSKSGVPIRSNSSVSPSRSTESPSFGHSRSNSSFSSNSKRSPVGKKGLSFRRSAGNQRSGRNISGHSSKRATNKVNLDSVNTLNIPPAGDNIRIIPLGGVEEIGRNMMAIEFRDEIIVIDAGIQFATEDTPGIDYLLPNTKYLEDRKSKIKALAITHGHLDHIGGIPYVMDRLGNPPIYTRDFGALLIQKRQAEFPHLPPLDIKVVGADDGAVKITENLKLRFFGLTHSIPDSTGVIIETPYGDIVDTGDVRVENDNGVPYEKEVKQYSIFKDRKVLLLAMDSTGSERPGWSLPEVKVTKTIDEIIKNAPGRVFIATFASQVERLIAFFESARRYGRKVVVEGRSMKTNVEIIKYLKLADTSNVISLEEMSGLVPNKILVLTTGGQGEEFAALVRMADKAHKHISIQKNDTVILSSSVIPGNESAVASLKDNLFRHDCRVVTFWDSDVHTSGHGKRGELEWVHKQIPYKFFMPIHGHHYMLKMHAEISERHGHLRSNIVVPDNGSIIEITDKGEKISVRKENVPSSPLMVDGFEMGDMREVVIRDRQVLSEDGMFVIIASLNSSTGKLRKSPDIISRGFVYLRESQELLQDARAIIRKTIEEGASGMRPIDFDFLKNSVTDAVGKFLFQKTAKRPLVIPVILGI